MLTRAQPWMIPDLKTLWHQCYGDSEEYIDFFMTHRFRPEETIVWLEEWRAVGVAYLLPCHVGEIPADYCYAVGVLPAFRGRGISGIVLSEAERCALERGRLLLISPRDGTLGYYRTRGMKDAFFCRWVEFSATGPTQPLTPVESDTPTYTRLRNLGLPQAGLVRWDETAMKYALAEHRLCGGFAHLLPWQGVDYLLLGAWEECGLLVTETTLPEALLDQLASSLCAHYSADRLICRLPGSKEDEPLGVCFGSITWEAGWLGFDLS